MLKYRDSKLFRPGFIGLTLIILVITVGLSPQRLVQLATAIRYQALFTEAGGIAVGNNVLVSGVKVGAVSDVSLQDGDALVTFVIDGKVRLGSASTAHIRTGSLLGARVLTV
jgi:phospholipid/cholesterol/gamma-HCH transport system substrate-binding protein